MKSPKPSRVVFVFAVTAAVFLFTDIQGVSAGGDWSILPTVLVQVVALTFVVGSWAYAMAFLETEAAEGEPPSDSRPSC